jgi:hypothetical protein
VNDKINAQINYLKLWIGVFIITWISLFGYLSSNYNNIGGVKTFLTVFLLFILLTTIYKLHNIINTKINLLKE